MNTLKPLAVVLIPSLAVALAVPGLAEQREGDDTQTVAFLQKKKSEKTPAPKFRPRLPNYYGQVGISREQRQKIYAIQRQYHEKIAPLRAQLEALEEQRDKEVAAVLTEEQLKKVEELRAKRRRGSRKKASSKEES